MRVDHTLGVPGGPAGVTHRRCITFVEDRPLGDRRGGREELFVAQHRAERRGVAVTDHDDGLHRGEIVADLGEQGHQDVVDDDDLVLGVIDHIAQLLGEEPDVQGVQHGAHRGNAEIGLHVTLVVPLKGPDPIAWRDPERCQRTGEATCALRHLGEGGGCVALIEDRDDLGIGEDGCSVAEYVADQQRRVLHGALQREPPPQPLGGRPEIVSVFTARDRCCLCAPSCRPPLDSWSPSSSSWEPWCREASRS